MNTYYIGKFPVTDELCHHGILGQKWGVRRYQNPDGTLTAAGKERYIDENVEKSLAKKPSKNPKSKNSISREISRERGRELASKGKTISSTVLSGIAGMTLTGVLALTASKKLYDAGFKEASGAMILYGGALVGANGLITAYDVKSLKLYGRR